MVDFSGGHPLHPIHRILAFSCFLGCLERLIYEKNGCQETLPTPICDIWMTLKLPQS
jgi:hypothetical protein